ncbi:hypothetical protein E4T52_16948 [Aureobasidium sp. EXF-3400]|nr:hypothetical protein E4T51_16200 [Aureobasidium sp. EXF-12344]KAI4767944.1 hypothetical protein E4T52_16948 [Aureobasidium sp. EXF-3400]
MENSQLSRLPTELRERILDFIMPIDIGQMDDCKKWNAVDTIDPTEKLLLMLARQHAFAATCRELQLLSLPHYLRHTEIIWDLSGASSNPSHASLQFTSLPSLQSRGFLDSIHGIGAVQSDDYLHREGRDTQNPWNCARWQPNWLDQPLGIIGIYQKTAFIASSLREQQRKRDIAPHRLFYRQIYRLPAFTDGNALRPIKKALRRTWKRDTMDITIDLLNEATSLQRMEEAVSVLDSEHLEKVEAIKVEVKRQEESSLRNNDWIFRDERFNYASFLYTMEGRYLSWKYRVRKFHEGLIAVVMLGYKTDYNDLHARVEEVRAEMERREGPYSGNQVVEAVIEMVKATELQGTR